jgi:hypothetical protein
LPTVVLSGSFAEFKINAMMLFYYPSSMTVFRTDHLMMMKRCSTQRNTTSKKRDTLVAGGWFET